MTLDKAFFATPISHRTVHDVNDGRPENSMAGAKAAIEHGYGIEIDLQLSKDGVPMVFHDYSLERLTGANGPIAQRTAAELSDIELTGGNEAIPTFKAFLKLVNGQVPILVELKDQDGALGTNVGVLEKATCALLQSYSGPNALMSFNPHSVAKCAEHAPEIVRGLVTERFSEQAWSLVPAVRREELNDIPDFNRVGASFISHNAKQLSDAPVTRLKSQGATIFCWTVRSLEAEKEARMVADNITFEGYLA
jgi:glycerophosphoryl diester phosphodiesterase